MIFNGNAAPTGVTVVIFPLHNEVISSSNTSKAPVKQVIVITMPNGTDNHKWSLLKFFLITVYFTASTVYPLARNSSRTPFSPGKWAAPTTNRVGASPIIAGIALTHAALRP